MWSHSSWRGTVDIEADRLALLDDRGIPHEVQNLFIGNERIVAPAVHSEEVGPGLPPTQLLAYEDPTDEQVPAREGLLESMAQERTPRPVYLTVRRCFMKH